jgi:hypothetical protein
MVGRVARSTFSAGLRAMALPLVGGCVLVAALFANEGCLTDACKGGVTSFGDAPGQGSFIDENTWQSVEVDADWLRFPHQTRIDFKHPLGRAPYEVLVWISAEQRPVERPGANFTLAGGDVATISAQRADTISVYNGTCADYYVRILARAAARPPKVDASEPSDGGAEGGALEGGVPEGGAPADASSD